MPQALRCPHCRITLQVPDGSAGRPVQCSACRKTFLVPAAAAPAPAVPVPSAVGNCPVCGAAMPTGAVSCLECGYLLHGAAAPPEPSILAPSPVTPVKPAQAKPAVEYADVQANAGDAAPAASRPLPPWAHLLPAGLLVLALLGIVLRDRLLPEDGSPEEQTVQPIVELPVDPEPRLALEFHQRSMQFGIVIAPEKDGTGGVRRMPPAGAGGTLAGAPERFPGKDSATEGKRLTYSYDGSTNNTCLRVDGRERLFGFPPRGRWKTKEEKLGRDETGHERHGVRSAWFYDDEAFLVTQTVELIPGEQVAAGATKRYLDTCLVRYVIENKDDRPHRVGLRFLLDTLIGGNDGVPFTIPGVSQLVNTLRDCPVPEEVPDFIQALETGDLANPGTVSHLTLRLGGDLEPPGRVSLCRWQQTPAWEVPVEDLSDTPRGPDSAVVMYWRERDIPPGGRRKVGFAYGLGHVSSGEGGKLGLTVGGSFKPGEEFTVTAYVNGPVPNQTLTLQLPAGLERVKGEATEAVPPLPPGSASRNSPVTWKVRAARAGRYTVQVRSNTGAGQSQAVTVRGSSGIFD